MKTFLCSLLLLVATSLFADESTQLAAVKAADKFRIEAVRTGDREKLNTIFSDDLRYAHSTGVVDTKVSFIDVLSSKKTKYLGYDYEEQTFTFPAPGIALMAGRAHVKAEADGKLMDSVLSYLAVWREENGQWRFLAWQSCKLPSVTK